MKPLENIKNNLYRKRNFIQFSFMPSTEIKSKPIICTNKWYQQPIKYLKNDIWIFCYKKKN